MKKLFLLIVLFVFISGYTLLAQTIVITGTVTSSVQGEGAIPGVTITVKGTTIGTITDVNGKFSLTAPQNATTLVFSYIGMKRQEVEIGGRKVFDVIMEPDLLGLNEVVVTAFGIKRQAKELGVATAQVSDKQLTQAGVSNVVNGLTGKVSGLQINTVNNGINPDTKITLRGNRHFLASNQALIVLDGVPVSADFLNSINPNDIGSVNVLKGASAAALYGNDASNGVLVISTRKGSGDKPVIKISNTTTFESVSYMPKLQNRFGSGSGEDTINSLPEYTFWIGRDRNTDPYTSYENQSFGPEFNGQMVVLGGRLVDGSYQMVPYSAVPNGKKKFFQTGISLQNDVSYSVGDDKNSFYLSAQDVNTTGTIPKDKNRRTGVRMAGARTTGIFHAEYTLSFTQTNTNVSGGEYFQQRPVYWNVLNTPAQIDLTNYKDVDNGKFANHNGYFNGYYPNPYWQLNHSRDIRRKEDVLGSALISLSPAPWIDISYRAGLTYTSLSQNTYRDPVVYNTFMQGDPWQAGAMGGGSPFVGVSSDGINNKFILNGDLLVQLNHINNRLGEPGVGEGVYNRNSIGVFADLTLGYKEFAYLHASARNDWDSRLTKANRSFFYPGVDASVILSEAIPVLKDNSFLSFAKIRGSWSKTGQISLDNWYATLPSFGQATGFPFGSTAGFSLSTALSNPLLKPELTREVEGGVELSFIRNRIHLEVNMYQSNTKNQTIQANLSLATGYGSAFINGGELKTNGLETAFKLTPVFSLGDFDWNLAVNYTFQTSEVLSIIPGLDELFINNVSYAIVGQQFPSLKVSDVKRDPQGHIIVDATTGYPIKDPALTNYGHGNPNHILSLVNTLNFKGLNLSVVAEYRTGNIILNQVGSQLDFTGTTWHTAQNGRQNFVIPHSVYQSGTATDGNPIYTTNTSIITKNASRLFWVSSDYTAVQSTYISSAAFWKLREISLSYDVPVKNVMNGAIKGLQVGVVGRNLIMLRPKTNIWTDPEFNAQGGNSNAVGFTDYNQTPPSRIYGFSVKLTF
jgi:TonB-dependent SusC/RagA subfamily outer membrane receptor